MNAELIEACVGGADRDAPWSWWALERRAAAAREAVTQLGFVLRERGRDALPGAQERALDFVFGLVHPIIMVWPMLGLVKSKKVLPQMGHGWTQIFSFV